MDSELTRRRLLELGFSGALTVTAAAGPALRWPERALADQHPRTSGWVHQKRLVRRGDPDDDAEMTLWATLMRVSDKITGYRDRWYLWHWTHDANLCRLYTAPNPTGPFRERACSIPNPPTGYRVFSAGDVAWEAPYFYATPHAHAPGDHNTFLLRSRDGQRWRYVTREPVLRTGPAGAFDAFAASYARFLRNLDGVIVRRRGNAVLYYRGQSVPSGPGRYAAGAATSSDLIHWTKLSTEEPLFKPAGGSLFMIGTALWEDNSRRVNLIYSVLNLAQLQWTMELKRAEAPRRLGDWSDGPGVPLYSSPFYFTDGGYLVVDRRDGFQYMALAAQRGSDTSPSIELLKSLG